MQMHLKIAQEAELNQSKKLKKGIQELSLNYGYTAYDNMRLLIYKNQLYIPERLRSATLNHWYKYYPCHRGSDRLANTIRTTCRCPDLHQSCK
jgi:hypothetical protein